MKRAGFVVALLLLTSCRTTSTEAFTRQVLDQFALGSQQQFDAVYPFEEGRGVVAYAIDKSRTRVPEAAVVLRQERGAALLMLGGYVTTGSSGDETSIARGFSGLYEARRGAAGWALTRRIPIGEGNRIRSHKLDVRITPGVGVEVRDVLDVAVETRNGFAVRLNHAAKIRELHVDGQPVKWQFGGGLLWIPIPPKPSSQVDLRYSIEPEHPEGGANSGAFLADVGHVRNQYFWHPFFDFSSEHDVADFDVRVSIPEPFQVVTSLPPRAADRIEGEMRIVEARSVMPTFAISLLYDRAWVPARQEVDGMTLEIFATPDFVPDRATLTAGFLAAARSLQRRFGTPQARYFAVVQSRARSGSGWHYLSNHAIVAGKNGGALSRSEGRPRHWFGHEVSHLWTNPAGPATNWLREGWATFAEAVLLREQHGVDTERAFWAGFRKEFFDRGFDGTASLLDDPSNGGVAYSKGGLVFAMIERVLGDDAFDRGMREYAAKKPPQTALSDFIESFGADAERARRFLDPWLRSKNIPRLIATTSDSVVTIRQSGPEHFWLPDFELEVTTRDGRSIRRRIEIAGAETVLRFDEPIARVVLDPEQHFLVQN